MKKFFNKTRFVTSLVIGVVVLISAYASMLQRGAKADISYILLTGVVFFVVAYASLSLGAYLNKPKAVEVVEKEKTNHNKKKKKKKKKKK